MKCGEGKIFRHRLCDSPRPSNGGRNCTGQLQEEQECHLAPCPGMSLIACNCNLILWKIAGIYRQNTSCSFTFILASIAKYLRPLRTAVDCKDVSLLMIIMPCASIYKPYVEDAL